MNLIKSLRYYNNHVTITLYNLKERRGFYEALFLPFPFLNKINYSVAPVSQLTRLCSPSHIYRFDLLIKGDFRLFYNDINKKPYKRRF